MNHDETTCGCQEPPYTFTHTAPELPPYETMLRDFFAGCALAGTLAGSLSAGERCIVNFDALDKTYDIADAMLNMKKAREKREKT